MSYAIIRMGTLFLDDCPQHNPRKPTWDGDIPTYKGYGAIDIRPTADGDECITWICPGGTNLLIADRCILSHICWDDLAANGFVSGKVVELNGRLYCCRLLSVGENGDKNTPNEWDMAIYYAGNDSETMWHTQNMFFWGNDDSGEGTRAVRGFSHIVHWNSYCSNEASASVGFRPVLEPVPTLTGIQTVLDGQPFRVGNLMVTGRDFRPVLQPTTKTTSGRPTIDYSLFGVLRDMEAFKAYTLLMDGAPVEQGVTPEKYKPGAKLEFTDKFFGKQYLINWEVRKGTACAKQPVLQGIDTKTANALGFTKFDFRDSSQ